MGFPNKTRVIELLHASGITILADYYRSCHFHISNKEKLEPSFIYIPIPKCANTAIYSALKNAIAQSTTSTSLFNNSISVSIDRTLIWKKGSIHRMGISHLLKNTYVFTVVRNPWDRAVSAWKHMNFFGYQKLSDYLKHPFLPNYKLRFLSKKKFADQTSHEWHNMPQVRYITYKNKIYPAAIYKLENLSNDWTEILKKIKLPYVKLEKKNTSKRGHYVQYYEKDPEAKELVSKIYAEDIKAFNYKFGEE